MKNFLYFAGYVATIPIANFMIGNVGTFCVPDGPCMIPVGFGMTAPSGVLMVGAALVLRDQIQENLGAKWALVGVLLGIIVSYFLADPFIAIASLTAFAASELSDFGVYTIARKWGRSTAVALSGLIGSIFDSVIFLWVAFGSLNFIEGQIFGKLVISLLAAAMIKIATTKKITRYE